MSEDIRGRAKGGVARAAALTIRERKEIAERAALTRWHKDIPQATHAGVLRIGDIEIECAVLPDGTRVLSERAITKGFGGKRGGAHWRRKKADEIGADLPVFLSAKNISTNLPSDLVKALTTPILYRSAKGAGRVGHGVKATLLPAICGALIELHRQKKLHPSQEPIAEQAARLAGGLAGVGIVALVDEATGYQEVRPRDELRRLLEAYVSPEFLPWTKRFPDEFYKELFRLRGWTYDPLSVKRPKLVGYLTENIVYKRLPEGVLEELKKLTPKDDSGRRRRKHHQFLTEDIGNPHLEKHVASAITLMKISGSYTGFKKHLDKALPMPKGQLLLPLDHDEDE
jgi:P63C domain